ncbi:ABC transporter [Actinotalea ferrariae CF5-4]|uniref:ABC-type quaternary amine transporter n=1 Tax=Actinotalea ferrariae CF5-4 TaxID=948458 RepID=A0A021VUR5_9CELL|nr:ATP-binding cassette domain-containing protein [Actinotalea ferrariae]EYR63805.1 ABC transporter [Actinotalea ferrariae CF5-4]
MSSDQPAGRPGTTGTDEAVIRFDRARKEYPDGTVAVHELDLEVREHELLVLVGASGCGKSTTLRMVNRLVEATSGRVLVEGRDVATVDPVALRRRIGYVIQDVGLFPHRTVGQNVATVPELLGWDRARTRTRVGDLLELVGLAPATYAGRYPHQLSGGERQRVGVARALAADPPVLLMDEPFGAVDPSGRRRLQQEFWRIQRELGTTVMFVTHDVDEAVRLGDRVAVFRRGGHLEQVSDAVTLLARPRTPTVAELVGTGSTVRLLSIGELTAQDVGPPRAGRAPDGASASDGMSGSDGTTGGDGGPTVALGDRLDVVLQALAAAPDGVPVTAGGAVVGHVTADALLRAVRRTVASAQPADAGPAS